MCCCCCHSHREKSQCCVMLRNNWNFVEACIDMLYAKVRENKRLVVINGYGSNRKVRETQIKMHKIDQRAISSTLCHAMAGYAVISAINYLYFENHFLDSPCCTTHITIYLPSLLCMTVIFVFILIQSGRTCSHNLFQCRIQTLMSQWVCVCVGHDISMMTVACVLLFLSICFLFHIYSFSACLWVYSGSKSATIVQTE